MNRALDFFVIIFFTCAITTFFFLYDVSKTPDFYSYLNWYETSISGSLSNQWVYFKDPAFFVLSNISYDIGLGVNGVIFTLIFTSLFLKVFFVKKFYSGEIFFWVVILYMARLFIIHDFIQYRAGAAVGVSSLFTYFYIKGNKAKAFLLLCIALCIHLSALLMLLILPIKRYLLRHEKQNLLGPIIFLFTILICIVILDPFKPIIEQIMTIPVLQARLSPYLNGQYEVISAPIFNSYIAVKLISYVIFVCWLYKNQSTVTVEKYFFLYILFFISLTGLGLYWFFRINDALSIRFSDFFALYDLIFIASLLQVFNPSGRFIFRFFLTLIVILFAASTSKLL